MSLKNIVTIFLIIISYHFSLAQELPYIINYSNVEYKAQHQNWDVTQDSIGHIYIANNAGLLHFNGVEWQMSTLPNNKIIRSVYCFQDKVYTGSYEDIGYWKYNNMNNLQYHSLKALVPKNTLSKEEIWHIFEHKGKLYFQSFAIMLMFDGHSFEKINVPGNIMFATSIDDYIYFPVIDNCLYRSTDGTNIAAVCTDAILKDNTITGIAKLNNEKLLISTQDAGVFQYENQNLTIWNSSLQSFFIHNQINKILTVDSTNLVLATISNGAILYDLHKNKHYFINRKNGLQNNTILSLHKDNINGFWMAMDKGISYCNHKSSIKSYFDIQGKLGKIYSSAFVNGIKYLGTNQGLFYYDTKSVEEDYDGIYYKPIPSVQGQVWQLLPTPNGLICGHNKGTDVIYGTQRTKISTINGGWHTIFLPDRKDILLQATYTGLCIFKLNSSWKLSHKIEGLREPIKKIAVIDAHNFILHTGADRLLKVQLSNNYERIVNSINLGKEQGLNTDFVQEVRNINNKIYVKTADQYFIYDDKKNTFYNSLNESCFLKSIDSISIKVCQDSLMLHTKNMRRIYKMRATPEYENVMPWDNNYLLVCLDNGGYSLVEKQITNQQFSKQRLFLNGIIINSNTQIFPINSNLPSNTTKIKILFSFLDFSKNVLFKYRLSPHSEKWSDWQESPSIEYFNLPSGTYTIELKTNLGHYINEKINILVPWYRRWYMYLLYLCCTAMLFQMLKEYNHRELQKRKVILDKENERQIREHKIALDNERLKEDNFNKSKELANSTMQLIKKNEILLEIKEELIGLRKTNEQLTMKDFQKMVRQINENVSTDHDLQLFETNFSEVHEEFFKKLIHNYPDLTPQDLKLAAYLKMNLSSKEMAPLFNISIRGMENKRYRFRKKIGLDNDTNLTEFLLKL